MVMEGLTNVNDLVNDNLTPNKEALPPTSCPLLCTQKMNFIPDCSSDEVKPVCCLSNLGAGGDVLRIHVLDTSLASIVLGPA